MKRLSSKKTIVVTGGLGFIGSHFVELALKNGHKVINVDCETYAANSSLRFSGDYTHIKEDIANINDIPFCDIIVNFAAESHVDNSISSSKNFISTNVLGVHNLLEILKNHKIKNLQTSWAYKVPLFVQISTDEVFGDILKGFFTETDQHKPSNPYAASKSCAEQLVYAWGRTYDLPYIVTRTTNNYGCRQFPEKLIPATIMNIMNGKKVVVHGDGRYVRNWIHVDDNVDALYKIIDQCMINESYHVSSDEEYNVREIVEKIASHFNLRYDDIVDSSTDRSGCDERYALDCSKLKEQTSWQQLRKLDVEIPKLIECYRKRI
jgi:dTDP-glucose 4,6-dehydratase